MVRFFWLEIANLSGLKNFAFAAYNFEPKEPHHKTGKINLRLFSMYLFIFYVITSNSASRSVNPIHLL